MIRIFLIATIVATSVYADKLTPVQRAQKSLVKAMERVEKAKASAKDRYENALQRAKDAEEKRVEALENLNAAK